jgi:hypothetical protein
MKGFQSSRAIIAGTQRITASSVGRLIASRPAGSGIWSQTLDGVSNGFDAPIVERAMDATGNSIFFIQSEKFEDRYYAVCQRANGDWHFSGDPKLAEKYIVRVWAFLIENATETIEDSGFIAPILNGPWGGVTRHISNAEMVEIHAQVRARMTDDERRAHDREAAFDRVWMEVRAIERRYARQAVA